MARQFAAPVAKRTFFSAVNASARPAVARAAAPVQQFRGMKTVDFAGDKEVVYERSDWPREKLLVSFKNDACLIKSSSSMLPLWIGMF